MSRRPAVALLGVVVAALAGCGAGTNAETQHERAVNLPTVHVGPLTVGGARLVPAAAAPTYIAQPTSTATPAAQSSATKTGYTGTLGYLVMSVVNSSSTADTLTNVSFGQGTVKPVGAPASAAGLRIPPTASVLFGDPSQGGGGLALAVSGLSHPLSLGTSMQVTVTFQNAGPVTIDVPVVDSADVGTTSTGGPIQTTGSYPSASASESAGP